MEKVNRIRHALRKFVYFVENIRIRLFRLSNQKNRIKRAISSIRKCWQNPKKKQEFPSFVPTQRALRSARGGTRSPLAFSQILLLLFSATRIVKNGIFPRSLSPSLSKRERQTQTGAFRFHANFPAQPQYTGKIQNSHDRHGNIRKCPDDTLRHESPKR